MTAIQSRLRPRFRSRVGRDPWWIWLTPLGAFILIGLAPAFGFTLVVAGVFAAALTLVLSRFPGPTLVALAWFLPLQIPGFSFLYHHGVPGALVRPFGAAKEAMVIALLIAAGRELAARRTKLDGLDKLLLAYVGALVVFLALPMLVSSPEFYPRRFDTRLLGFRVNAGFVLAFVAARHAPITERWRRRFVASILAVTGVMAAIGVYQFLRPESFTDIVINDLGIPFYHFEILDTPIAAIAGLLRWTTARPVRVGSLFVQPFTFADFMLLPAGLVLAQMAWRGARARDLLLLGVVGAAVLASQTRANILALIAMVLISLAPVGQRVLANRLRIVAIAAVAAVAFIPSLASSRLGGTGEAAKSTEGHVNEIQFGLQVLEKHPLGLGLGTAPAVAARDEDAPLVISDNSILQVGNELGAGMMVFFVVILVTMVLRLGRAARDDPGNNLAAGARLALLGLVIAGQFHHVFQFFAVSWLLFAVAGLALRGKDSASDGEEGPDERDRETADASA